MRKRYNRMWAIAMLAAAPCALAQDEQPAIDTSGGEQPAVSTSAPATQTGYGMTILGERETPIGLFITPWRNSVPEPELNRPAKLLDDELLPLDREVFARYVNYSAALSEHRKAKELRSGLEQ